MGLGLGDPIWQARLISGLLHFTGPSGVNSHLLAVGPGTKRKGFLCPSRFHEVTREERREGTPAPNEGVRGRAIAL